ncbi:MAG: GMC family oxidoreductase N-terminal domain-containing protein, partial [Burkholderiales bacterium]
MADGFLHPIRKRPNLTLITGALAHRVLFERADCGPRACGIEFSTPDGIRRAEVRRELVLAAGSIGSVQLLQLSGIGAGALLQSLGIDVVRDTPDVGGHLQDHLQIRTVYKVRNCRTVNTLYHNPVTRLGMGLQYLLTRTGPMTMPPSTLGAFTRSDPEQPTPNIEWHVQPLSLPRFGEPLHRFGAITPSVCNLRPTSRGHVRIVSPDPKAHPEIRLNYLSTDEDRRVAVDSLRITRRIMAANALAPFQPEEMLPGASLASDEELVQAAGDMGTTIFHPVGTCRMGRDDGAVVDAELRVRGIDRLRVIDASVMPRITSGNTNAPTVMIAERGVRYMLGRSA